MGIHFLMLLEGEVPLDFESDWLIGTTWTIIPWFPVEHTGQERSGVQCASCTLNIPKRNTWTDSILDGSLEFAY